MTPEKLSPVIQRALGINFEKLNETVGSDAHNMREEWTAVLRKVSDFSEKYVEKKSD